MSKTATAATISPWRLSVGNGVYLEDVRAVIEQSTYTFGQITNSHLSVVTAPDGWGDSGDEVYTHNVTFPATATSTLYYQTETWIDADVVNLYVEAFVSIGAGAACTVHYAIGSGSASLSFPSAGAANANTTIATSATGTGWQILKVTLQTNTVGSASSSLLELRAEDVAQATASAIRDPLP